VTRVGLPRILFVDDDPQVLDGLEASLWRLASTWDMTFVLGGRAAISALLGDPVDAVVTDMRMPGADGEAVLTAARTHRPGAIRIVLSGQTDPAVTTRATALAHQFLSKPCPQAELRECLERALGIAHAMPARLREIVCGAGALAMDAATRACLDAQLARSVVDEARVLACIGDDVVLSARLIHVAGAGFFARRQAVTSVAHALDILGLDVVRAFAASMEARGTVAEVPHVGAASGGLSVSVGQLTLLDRFGDRYVGVLTCAAADPTRTLGELEVEKLGVTHAAVGEHLLRLWGLEDGVVIASSSR
jgi:DNA-binding NarL/FixJ family response regulator